MPTKSFSIYSAGEESNVEENDKLVIELGKSHFACMLSKAGKRSVAAFELYDFSAKEASDPEKLFTAISLHSKILSGKSAKTHVFINNELCIPVPVFKFNKEIVADYLDLVFGNDHASSIQFEHLPIDPGIMNVYKVHDDQLAFLHQMPGITFHHTYSNVIRRHAVNAAFLPTEFVSVQFYSTCIIAMVMKDGRLQLIQSFSYENAEDVLYYLLNICDRFQFYSNTLTLLISGMIDLEFKLYRELIKYFRHVVVDQVDKSVLLPDLIEHPSHYFTPFFNLAI